ncbi:MAG: FomA family porin-like outer membrane protein, partial [Cetobacterium sp.]
LLGSLLVVGATASAKEAVVAPVEVSKEVVVVAEPVVEVVEEAFRPSGFVGLQYKVYGETEGHNDKIAIDSTGAASDHQDSWNRGNNNYSRLETSFGIQATENFKFEGRIRDFNNLDRNDASSATKSSKKAATETRLRFSYKHNDVFTSRFQYRDEENNSQNFEYRALLNAYTNKGALVSKVSVQPYIYHVQPADNGGDYQNMVGAQIAVLGDLFAGFNYEFNTYLEQWFYNQDIQTGENSFKDKEAMAYFEFYLYNTVGLYANDNTSLDLNLDAGFDPYSFSQYGRFDKDTKKVSDKNTYEARVLLDVTVTHQLTPSLAINAGVGAEYRNWNNTAQSSASDWRWQPLAFAGMNVKF